MSRKRGKIIPKDDFVTKNVEIVPESDPKWDPEIDKNRYKFTSGLRAGPKASRDRPGTPKVVQKTPTMIPNGTPKR